MSTGIAYSNSPASGERHIYKQLFFPWPEAVDLTAGDHLEVRLGAYFVQSDYVWSWETRVLSGERVKAEFRQSTLNGVALSSDRLRKRAHGFVPEPNEDFAGSTASCSTSCGKSFRSARSRSRFSRNIPCASRLGTLR
jgi:hypothetical protein